MIIKPIVYAPYKSGGKFPYPVKDIMLPYSETYNGNVVIKKARAKTDLTNDHILEIYKCSKDPIYFIENYCRIISLDEGLVPFKMYEFQKDMIKLYTENRYSLALTSRQLGKTSVMAAFIVWYSIFHEEKTTAVLANKGDAAQEIMDRIRLMLENLPFFLQPGVSIYNRRSIELDNGSKIFSAATGAGGIRGRSCVAGTTKVTIRNKITGEVKLVNIDDLAHILNKSVASNKSIEETNEQPGDIIKIRFQ
jgi:hypothetical protein